MIGVGFRSSLGLNLGIGCSIPTTGSIFKRWQEHITVDPGVLVGKPIIKGTRLAVDFVLELVSAGWSEADILRNYPRLGREDILACVAYARRRGQSR